MKSLKLRGKSTNQWHLHIWWVGILGLNILLAYRFLVYFITYIIYHFQLYWQVINETVRLANIVPGIFRKAVEDVEVKGKFIVFVTWGVVWMKISGN